jgi:hypothetical protein
VPPAGSTGGVLRYHPTRGECDGVVGLRASVLAQTQHEPTLGMAAGRTETALWRVVDETCGPRETVWGRLWRPVITQGDRAPAPRFIRVSAIFFVATGRVLPYLRKGDERKDSLWTTRLHTSSALSAYESPLTADELKVKHNSGEVGFETSCGGCGMTIKAKRAPGFRARINSFLATLFRK